MSSMRVELEDFLEYTTEAVGRVVRRGLYWPLMRALERRAWRAKKQQLEAEQVAFTLEHGGPRVLVFECRSRCDWLRRMERYFEDPPLWCANCGKPESLLRKTKDGKLDITMEHFQEMRFKYERR